jgi:hypothetical protein
MTLQIIEDITRLRICVGYLGEKDQYGWWQSSFFTQGSDAFLAPLFSRTKLLAQCNGVTQAAALIHDERIGVGHVYHLFRLPEDLEQGIHQSLHESELINSILGVIPTKLQALDYLAKQSIEMNDFGIGPTRIGDIDALRNINSWHVASSLYHHALLSGQAIFPYFTDFS